MKQMKTMRIPACDKVVLDKLVCDICGAEVETISSGEYEFTRVEIEDGWRYGNDESSTTLEYDICAKCFKEKLMPFLASLGAKPREEDYVN